MKSRSQCAEMKYKKNGWQKTAAFLSLKFLKILTLYFIIVLYLHRYDERNDTMLPETIMGIPALNLQALLGLIFFLATFFLVKLIRGIQTGRYPGGTVMIFYLRTVLWCAMIGGLVFFFGAILGFRYI